MTGEPVEVIQAEADRRRALSHHEQMLDAQSLCAPCKLCGGHAVISDAGTGAGYNIRCSNSVSFRDASGCLIDHRRLGGWAYNVMDWWNRLHRLSHSAEKEALIEALEPFARQNPHKNEDGSHGILVPATVADVRRARSTLLSMRNNGNG